MVVIVQAGGAQPLRLIQCQHAQGHAGLQAQIVYGFHHGLDLRQIGIGGIAPGSAHAKARGTLLAGGAGGADHLVQRQ